MIKKITVLILSIFSLYTNATSVEFNDQYKFDNCKRHSSLPIIHCEKNGVKAMVHVDSTGGLQGLVQNERTSRVETFAVRQITNGQEVTYFNALSDKLNEDPVVDQYKTPADEVTKLMETSNSINKMLSILPVAQTEYRSELIDIQDSVTKSLDRLESHISSAQYGMWVVDNSGKKTNCEIQASCPIKRCGDNHMMIYDAANSIYMPVSFSRDFRGKPVFTKNDKYITSVRSMSGVLVDEIPEFKESRLSTYRKVPQEMQNNATAFFNLQDSRFAAYVGSVMPYCDKKTQEDIIGLAKSSHNLRSSMDLVHVVDVVNGKINSQYINKQFIPKNSCRDGDSFYTQDTYEQVEDYRPHSSGTISLAKAKELARKAKAMKGMAWGYSKDGCYARAELMVNMFEEEGVVADKAWTAGFLKAPKAPGTTWSYHVAPVVYVNTPSGHVEKMIIDPAISDEPMEVNQWLGRMGVDGSKVDQIGFPPALEASVFGKNSFGIADRSSFNPTVGKRLDRSERAKHSRELLAEYEKRI